LIHKKDQADNDTSNSVGLILFLLRIGVWKRQVLEQLPILFSERIQQKEKDSAELIASLYQQIGQLKVESDWLKKSLLSSSRGETGANRRRTQPDPHNATM
jgi:hypothetical protein